MLLTLCKLNLFLFGEAIRVEIAIFLCQLSLPLNLSSSLLKHSIFLLAFLRIAAALGVAFLYYPYFGCLASYHRIIGALVGLSYAVA